MASVIWGPLGPSTSVTINYWTIMGKWLKVKAKTNEPTSVEREVRATNKECCMTARLPHSSHTMQSSKGTVVYGAANYKVTLSVEWVWCVQGVYDKTRADNANTRLLLSCPLAHHNLSTVLWKIYCPLFQFCILEWETAMYNSFHCAHHLSHSFVNCVTALPTEHWLKHKCKSTYIRQKRKKKRFKVLDLPSQSPDWLKSYSM